MARTHNQNTVHVYIYKGVGTCLLAQGVLNVKKVFLKLSFISTGFVMLSENFI